jgi:HNH endonuclease
MVSRARPGTYERSVRDAILREYPTHGRYPLRSREIRAEHHARPALVSALIFVRDGRAPRATSIAKYLDHVRCDPCAYCGAPSQVLDHIVPALRYVAEHRRGGLRRGTDSWANLTAACTECNGSKGSKSLLAFLGIRAMHTSDDGRIYLRLAAEGAGWRQVGRFA